MAEITRSVTSTITFTQVALGVNISGYTIYGSIQAADSYWARKLDGQRWGNTSHERKLQSLFSATKIIESLNFAGVKADEEQPLEFPRDTESSIPEAINEACYEIALALLRGINPDTERDNLFATIRAYGGMRTEYGNRLSIPDYYAAGVPSPRAWDLLLPYMQKIDGVRLERVS